MPERLLVSAFLVCHLAALIVVAVPGAGDLQLASGTVPPGADAMSLGPLLDAPASSDDALSAIVRPVLDVAGRVTEGLARHARYVTAWVRPLAVRYADGFGLAQGWSMFGNPPRGSEFLRLRYFTSTGGGAGDEGPLTVTTELVFPAPNGREPRLARAYWHGHRDKAISNAFTAHLRARIESSPAHAPATGTSSGDAAARRLRPVMRYFSEQHARTRLGPRERLVRTEAWYGWATSRGRGDVPMAPRAHAAVLERYHRGPARDTRANLVFQPPDSLEREADLLWILIGIDTP